MITDHARKKLIASTLGTATVPTLLFCGAGTAQADKLQVITQPSFGGVTIIVFDNTNPPSNLGGCVYSSTPNTTGIPYFGPPFELNPSNPTFQWFAPGLETGTTWTIAVHCAQGPQTVTPGTITY
ncbi:MAG: hypothetical protein WAN71_06135 [Mycobacterium sp.]|uniref:hypothetical protein n=1 Tax=Mycobacterium sp. TaxID=1785 RepID=UPI003BB15412